MRLHLSLLFAAIASISALAQSQDTVIVPDASQVAPAKPGPATVSNSNSSQSLLKMLKEMKAANEETLRKQATQLDQLDELQKVAEEIRMYTRRS